MCFAARRQRADATDAGDREAVPRAPYFRSGGEHSRRSELPRGSSEAVSERSSPRAGGVQCRRERGLQIRRHSALRRNADVREARAHGLLRLPIRAGNVVSGDTWRAQARRRIPISASPAGGGAARHALSRHALKWKTAASAVRTAEGRCPPLIESLAACLISIRQSISPRLSIRE